ncbi:MAG: DoxX family protein, partial [Gammaproteobacteria bacterium]|nr:DoxX family protein [Gammaproteobacteria bacterium]
MSKLLALWERVVGILNPVGDWIALLPIRLLLAYEFGTAGLMKYNGNNWFANVQDNFLFPFSVIPVEISWFMSTWAELLGAFGLVIGLFTRFWAISLIILSVVAIFAVHMPAEWPGLADLWDSYRVT